MDGYDVYKKFKEAEAIKKCKPVDYSHYKKISEKNKQKLNNMADMFNTIYQNINVLDYVCIGFDLWKSFNLSKIDDKKIFDKYKALDKKKKRETEIDEKTIKKSIDYIKLNYNDIFNYCENRNGVIKQPIFDYIKNTIDPIVLSFLIEKKYIKLNDEEKALLSYFMINYTTIKFNMYKNYNFLQKNL